MRRVGGSSESEEEAAALERTGVIVTIAQGIAHEINNPLAVISANLEILQRELDLLRSITTEADSATVARFIVDASDLIKDTREGADRIAGVIRDLKILARPQDAGDAPLDVDHVLQVALRIAHTEIRPRARLRQSFQNVPKVHANEGRLGHLFLGLIVRAVRTMAEGQPNENELSVTTSLDLGQVSVRIRVTAPGKDFGPDLESERLVEELGGSIAVEHDPHPGTGVSLVVALPTALSKATGVAAAAGASLEQKTSTRRKRVLIVDDERMLGTSLARLLSGRYDPSFETNPRTALARIEAGERFDAILCDLAMPVMTGDELFAAIRVSAPDQAERFVFMTGGALTERAHAFLESVPNPRMEKPIQPEVLFTLLGERLS